MPESGRTLERGSPLPKVRRGSIRVLLVDDEPGQRRIAREFLGGDEGIEVVGEAGTAEEALELLSRLHPDVVLMDVQLPGLDGITATRLLRGVAPDVEVVGLTGFDDVETIRGLVEAGATGYLVKGEGFEDLRNAVRRAAAGEALLSPRVTKRLLQDFVDLYQREHDRAEHLATTIVSVSHALTAAIEARDANTSEHSLRVVQLALDVLRRTDPGAAEDPATQYGFLLHDVGKIAVPDAVLLKPAGLDPDEWNQMRQHPLWGAQILDQIAEMKDSKAVEIVRHHHERWDGSGYPYGLARTDIPSACRAFAVVDAFDAMTSDRPYRAASPIDQALAEIRSCRGTQFDPLAADAFLEILGS